MLTGILIGLVVGLPAGWYLARKFGAKGDAVVAAAQGQDKVG